MFQGFGRVMVRAPTLSLGGRCEPQPSHTTFKMVRAASSLDAQHLEKRFKTNLVGLPPTDWEGIRGWQAVLEVRTLASTMQIAFESSP